MRYFIIATLALLITGCAGMPEFLAGSDSDNALGTHKIMITDQCNVDVDQRTIRGGSNVTVTKGPDGVCTAEVSASKTDAVQKALELLK